MKRVYTFLTFLFCYQFLAAQNDSLRIKQQILSTSFANPDQELIQKSRTLLLTCVRQDSLVKVKEVLDYVSLRYQHSEYTCLWNQEEWLLRYWTQDYDSLLAQVLRITHKQDFLRSEKQIIEPPKDDFFINLIEFTHLFYLKIESAIQKKTRLSSEQKDFLLLHLQHLLSYREYYTQELLNARANAFLSDYPSSPYQAYVRQYIRFVFTPSRFGYGLDFYMGGDFFTGNLSSHVNNVVSFGHGFDFTYNKAVLYLRNHLSGASVLKKDFTYRGYWPQGLRVTLIQPEVSMGYLFHENQRVKFVPYAGVSWLGFYVATKEQEANPAYKDYKIPLAFTYTLGLNTDVKLAKTQSCAWNREENGYWLIRIRCGYNLPSLGQKRLPEFSGNMYYFRIGIGGFGRMSKRRI